MPDDPRTADLIGALRKLMQAEELLSDHDLDTPSETIACHDALSYAQSLIIEALECAGVTHRQYTALLNEGGDRCHRPI